MDLNLASLQLLYLHVLGVYGKVR